MATVFFDAVFCAFVEASSFTTKTRAQLPDTRFSTKWFSTKCIFLEETNFYYIFLNSVLEAPHFIGEMPTGIHFSPIHTKTRSKYKLQNGSTIYQTKNINYKISCPTSPFGGLGASIHNP